MSAIRILIVEDERIVSRDIQNTLKRLSYKPLAVATTGEEAISLAGDLQPDLILMDIRLEGDLDGVEAARIIDRKHKVPVIFLTGLSDAHTLDRAKATGSFGYVLKPFEEHELKFAIEIAVSKHKLETDLREATKAAQAANEAKTAFLATVSHELRTPMNGILGMAELLLHSALDNEQKEYLELIKNSGWALMNVLNDILDYAKIEAKTLELRMGEFNLRELVQGVVRSLAFQARKKGLSIDCVITPDIPRWLKGDSGRLRKIITHLLHNAIKFSDSGGVALDIGLDQAKTGRGQPLPENVRLIFSIADTGIGVPDGQLGTIFESFTQVESYLTRRYGGLGLGLATCKQLVGLLGGDIRAESALNQGSVFTFSAIFETLPQADPRQAPTHRPCSADMLKGRRVLLADDDPTSETLVYHLIEAKGMEVVCVSTGAQAVQELTRHPFDLVLMDIQMPELDGLEATRTIRNPATGCHNPHIPIIALTAHAFKSDEEACLAAGMDAYLAKPVDGSTLCAAMESILTGRHHPPASSQPQSTSQDLNLTDTLRRLGGDLPLLREVYHAFATDLPNRLKELESQLASGDMPGALRSAHSLKGAAMNAGAERLRDAASTVFDRLKAQRPDLADQAMAELHASFQQALTLVLNQLRTPPAPGPGSTP